MPANKRIAAEEAMRAQRVTEAMLERVRALIEALPDAIVVTDSKRRIRIVNNHTEHLLYWTMPKVE